MKKIIIAAAIAVCMTATMVGGCGATNDAHEEDGTASQMERYEPWCGGVYVWTDPDTNVQYLVCQDYRDRGIGVGITPRLNLDGSVHVEVAS